MSLDGIFKNTSKEKRTRKLENSPILARTSVPITLIVTRLRFRDLAGCQDLRVGKRDVHELAGKGGHRRRRWWGALRGRLRTRRGRREGRRRRHARWRHRSGRRQRGPRLKMVLFDVAQQIADNTTRSQMEGRNKNRP